MCTGFVQENCKTCQLNLGLMYFLTACYSTCVYNYIQVVRHLKNKQQFAFEYKINFQTSCWSWDTYIDFSDLSMTLYTHTTLEYSK